MFFPISPYLRVLNMNMIVAKCINTILGPCHGNQITPNLIFKTNMAGKGNGGKNNKIVLIYMRKVWPTYLIF